MDRVEHLLETLLQEVRSLSERMTKPLPSVLTKKAAARELSRSVGTIERMIRENELLTCELHKTVGVPRSEIERIIREARPKRPRRGRPPSKPRKPSPQLSKSELTAELRRRR